MKRRRIMARWTGASFVPAPSDMIYSQNWFKVGEVYVIDPEQEQSGASRRHYFAQLKEAWRNLPERLMPKYPTEEIFRKKLLIECGYFHESDTVCDTARDAATIAAFMAPLDPAAVITVRGRIIKKYIAKSQSTSAMDHDTFQKSKRDVLDMAATLIEVTPKQLEKNAGKSA